MKTEEGVVLDGKSLLALLTLNLDNREKICPWAGVTLEYANLTIFLFFDLKPNY